MVNISLLIAYDQTVNKLLISGLKEVLFSEYKIDKTVGVSQIVSQCKTFVNKSIRGEENANHKRIQIHTSNNNFQMSKTQM